MVYAKGWRYMPRDGETVSTSDRLKVVKKCLNLKDDIGLTSALSHLLTLNLVPALNMRGN
jgi:hypothetical protein